MIISGRLLFAGLFVLVLLNRCNTLNNVQTIDLEIFVPPTIILSPKYQNVAVRYNNSNFNFEKWFAESPHIPKSNKDTLNTDSIAFENYYNNFVVTIKNEQFFDSVIVIQTEDYSGFSFSDSLFNIDSVKSKSSPFRDLTYILTHIKNDKTNHKPVKYINPELGLYSRNELEKIADTTNSDILLSLDLLSAFYGIEFDPDLATGVSVVYNMAFWNFYDLKEKKIVYQYNQIDTVTWQSPGMTLVESMLYMPEKDSAVIEAAAISGVSFAESITPHWVFVQRMYYTSGHIELKKTEKLITEGKWLEAAAIWKDNIDNKNKKIAAKSMFNLALACEMEGELDAAIEWAVKSYHIFGEENKLHAENCKEYIRILSVRKRDLKIIERQLNPEQSASS
jgi:hypothetical protein